MADKAKKSLSQTKFRMAVAGTDMLGVVAHKPNPKLSWAVLRAVKDANPIVNVVVESLKHMVIKIPFHIGVKDEYKNNSEDYETEINYLHRLFERPNPQEGRRIFWLKVLEDILTIDRGCIEKVRDSRGLVTELWSVDGATIKPLMDAEGYYMTPAYAQYLPGEAEACALFEEDELDVLMNSPLSHIDMIGYGKSPIERIILTILTSINSENFNASVFDKNALPPFMINLPGATEDQVNEFKTQWEAGTEGKLWKAMFTNIDRDGMIIEKLRESNQEMQYYELTLWLAKVIVAAFEISPQDVGLTMDINKATGEVQERNTKNQGIRNMLDLMSEYANSIIRDLAEVAPRFGDLEYVYTDLDRLDAKTQAEIDEIYTRIGKVLPEELRARDGIPDFTEEQQAAIKEKSANLLGGLIGAPADNKEITKNNKYELYYSMP
jgi:phage portal protein BeeE